MASDIGLRIVRQRHIRAAPYLRNRIPPLGRELLQPAEESIPVFVEEGDGSVVRSVLSV